MKPNIFRSIVISTFFLNACAPRILRMNSMAPSSTSASAVIAAAFFPVNQQGAKLVGTGNVGSAYQGKSVSISSDGNTALVGGYFDNGGQGATWVFLRTGTVWTQQARLVGTGNVGTAGQGGSSAISSDGNTALIGGSYDNGSLGAAWVFVRTFPLGIPTWTQEGKLIGTGSIGNARQAYSAAISSDGNTALIGGYGDNNFQGAAWVFTRAGGVWTQQGLNLVGTGNVGAAGQGYTVALTSDGNSAFVGGPYDNTNQGATWVFTRAGGVWTQQGLKLVGTGNVGPAYQGQSIGISSDGNTALFGGANDNGSLGAIWFFTRSGTIWSQQGSKFGATGNVGNALVGQSLAMSSDGNTAIAGGASDNGNQGATWVFTRSGLIWTQQGSKLIGTGNAGAATQGAKIAISSDGGTTLIGGYDDNGQQGAVWVFTP